MPFLKQGKFLSTINETSICDLYAICSEWKEFENFKHKKTQIFDGRLINSNATFTIGK